MIREHAEYAFVELVFEAGERTAEKLKQMDIFRMTDRLLSAGN